MVLHIDMDAFFASIEQAINPRLKGKPLIVGSRGNKLHTVVCAASYEAKAYGIDSGMPSREAFQLCPNLEFVLADQGKYIWTSEQILEILKGYGWQVNYASIDEFQMDIGQNLNPEGIAKDIKNRIQEAFRITASVGIAKNCLLAKLGSKLNKPNGIVVINQANLEGILAQVEVDKLCGVGAKTAALFEDLGIRTCLNLYQKPLRFLEQILGKYGLNLYTALHSTDYFNPANDPAETKSIGHSYTLPKATENTGFIKAWIRLLSEMVARRLRQQNMQAKTIHLWLNGPEIAHFGAQQTFQQPVNDGYEVYLRSLKIMAKIGQKTPKIRALGVSCSKLVTPDYPALFKEQRRRQDLMRTLDSINNRYGEECIHPAIIYLTKKV